MSSIYRFNFIFFFFNDTATTEIYTLSLHDALPISAAEEAGGGAVGQALYRLPGKDGAGIAAMIGEARLKTRVRSEEHTSELQSQSNLACRLLLEKKKTFTTFTTSVHRAITS